MRCFHLTLLLAAGMASLPVRAASAQPTLERSGVLRGGVPANDRLGLRSAPSTARYGYRTLLRSPAYLQSTSPPRLNHIPPQYQSAYRFDRGGPSFGNTLPYYPLSPGRSRTLLPRSYGIPSGASYRFYRGPVFRPYVTSSQYVYWPEYEFPTEIAPGEQSAAVYGAYGLSALSSR